MNSPQHRMADAAAANTLITPAAHPRPRLRPPAPGKSGSRNPGCGTTPGGKGSPRAASSASSSNTSWAVIGRSRPPASAQPRTRGPGPGPPGGPPEGPSGDLSGGPSPFPADGSPCRSSAPSPPEATPAASVTQNASASRPAGCRCPRSTQTSTAEVSSSPSSGPWQRSVSRWQPSPAPSASAR